MLGLYRYSRCYRFLVLTFLGKRLKSSSFKIGIFLTLLSFIFSVLILFERFTSATYKAQSLWLEIGTIKLTIGFEVNQLNALMLVIVSLVSLLVHIYSAGYMKGDNRLSVYYAYLGLFTFAMLELCFSLTYCKPIFSGKLSWIRIVSINWFSYSSIKKKPKRPPKKRSL